MRARLSPEVFTLLDLHSCYAFWVLKDADFHHRDRYEVFRIRHNSDERSDHSGVSFVDIADCHWNNIEAWKSAIDLCCKQYWEAK